MNRVECIFVVLLALLCSVESLPTGAPLEACDTLTPNVVAHLALPQTTPAPYSIDLSPFANSDGGYSYLPGETYTLTLSGISSEQFRGFLVQARLQVDQVTRVGLFAVADAVNSRLSSCSPPTDGVTHSNGLDKPSVSFQWTAPLERGTGPIHFIFSVVQLRNTFWVNQRTSAIFEGSAMTVPLFPHGADFGDSVLPMIDDVSSPPIILDTHIFFYDNQESVIYVNSNGMLSFRDPLEACCGAQSFPPDSLLVAPFWHDVNTENGGEIYYRQTTDPDLLAALSTLLPNFEPTLLFIVTWNRVAPYASPSLARNTFQAVLATDGVSRSIAIFLYESIEWGENAQIGFSAGDEDRSFSLPISLTPLTLNVEERSNIGYPGIYIFELDGSSVIESGSVSGSAPPSASGSTPLSGSGSGTGPGSGTGLILFPFGEEEGDNQLPPVDDGNSGALLLDVPVVFFGRTEHIAFISSNGLLSFQSGFDFCCPPRDFPLVSAPLISPYWHDIDVRFEGSVYYRQTADPSLLARSRHYLIGITPYNFIPTNLLIVTWDRVPPFTGVPVGDLERNTFQLVIATDGVISSAIFLYEDIQWGPEAQIGFNAGDGLSSFSLPGALTDDTVNIEEQSNVNRRGIFVFRIDDLARVPLPTTQPPTVTTPTTVAPTDAPNPFFVPFGVSAGDMRLPVSDDFALGPIFLRESFTFFGKIENETYIGTNGVISFQEEFTLCCGPRVFPQGPPPLIAPFWHDIDTNDGGDIFYRITFNAELLQSFEYIVSQVYSKSFTPREMLIVTWDRVAPFSVSNQNVSNTFQLWLGSDGRVSFVVFLYGDVEWGENAQIGFNAGDGMSSFSLPESLTADTVDIELRSNINEEGVFVFRVDDLAIVCPPGTYLSNYESQMCLPCPPNTILSIDNATICPCLSGYFRSALDGPEDGCTQPPTACRDIRVTSIGEQNATISWERPEDVGRDDFYYVLSYSDGERAESFTVVSGDSVVEYTLRGLKPATDYTITVVVENGVSDQQPQSEPLRSCQVKLTTNDGRPSPPTDFQTLCNVIVWAMPARPNGIIVGYEAQFYVPGTQLGKVREIAQDRTFYIVKEDDELLSGSNSNFARVRAVTRAGPGQWSRGRNLGCEDPVTTPPATCPPCECPTCPTCPPSPSTPTPTPPPSVYFEHNGQMYGNNSVLSLADVGEGTSALLCKTNLIDCCGTVPFREGEFYYPNGIQIPIDKLQHGFYRNRGDQVVRLNRRQNINAPNGKFRCVIPDADGVTQSLYVTLI